MKYMGAVSFSCSEKSLKLSFTQTLLAVPPHKLSLWQLFYNLDNLWLAFVFFLQVRGTVQVFSENQRQKLWSYPRTVFSRSNFGNCYLFSNKTFEKNNGIHLKILCGEEKGKKFIEERVQLLLQCCWISANNTALSPGMPEYRGKAAMPLLPLTSGGKGGKSVLLMLSTDKSLSHFHLTFILLWGLITFYPLEFITCYDMQQWLRAYVSKKLPLSLNSDVTLASLLVTILKV